MSEELKIAGLFSYLKDISSFLRDVLLTIIVAICIINPSSIKTFLKDSGLSKLGVFGVTVELSAPVVTVGDKLKVVELDYSSAKGGGFFVWVKAAIQSS